MFKKSAKQKRLEYLSKFMTNGYRFALIDGDGEIKATYRYKYEMNTAHIFKGQEIVTFKELFDSTLDSGPN
ncbi:hypothetical protein KKJ25_19865 [Xenorhabdus bovienii]|uniref:hypothetical protein n=1 Tax=Xenorhabdus bovienii TaxID=40576 RepID=UPI00237CE9C6|nr:hypothetical protein [Xenorhabdus bovienii]MDE1497123.1 hypothetical protein [Xenorhabdus bovienii]